MGSRGPKSRSEVAREVREATRDMREAPAESRSQSVARLDETLDTVLRAAEEMLLAGRCTARDVPELIRAITESRVLLADPGIVDTVAAAASTKK